MFKYEKLIVAGYTDVQRLIDGFLNK